MKKVMFIIAYLLLNICLSAQTITIDFPKHPNKMLTLSLKQGTVHDTIYHALLDTQGKAYIGVPLASEDYRGMAKINIDGGATLDIIITGKEAPTIFSPDEYLTAENITFSNSLENESLQQWFLSQAMRQQKTGILKDAEFLYQGDTRFYPLLRNEKESLELEQKEFEGSLSQSPLYAARFIEFYNFLNSKVAGLLYADSLQMAKVRTFVCDSLDVEALFTSGLWFNTLNGMLALYDNNAPYHKDFISDMCMLLKRCKSDKTYMMFAEDLFAICEATGWNDMEDQLAYYLINDGRINNPSGKLKKLINLFKLSKGNKVPELTNGKLPEGKCLIVFYETGCNNCENEMLSLKANYPVIKEKGYTVVSISADIDENVFRNTAETYPWTDKYCDLKSFQGEDFFNYGVIGTPTFYVVDENYTLLGRYARLLDTGLLD